VNPVYAKLLIPGDLDQFFPTCPPAHGNQACAERGSRRPITRTAILSTHQSYPDAKRLGFACGVRHRSGSEFVTDGEKFTFPSQVLLKEFPVSHHAAISDSLRPRIETSHVVPRGPLRRFRDAIFPGVAARSSSRDSPENLASLKDWLRSRGKDLVPGRAGARVEIHWFQEVVRVDGDRLDIEREPIDTLVVTLDREQI
jgi:hypothetical protein